MSEQASKAKQKVKGERIGNDAYYTPDKLARSCVSVLGIDRMTWAWEPHAGAGSFVRALREKGARGCVVSDIDPESPATLLENVGVFDKMVEAGEERAQGWPFEVRRLGVRAFEREEEHLDENDPRVKLIVGNPPYENAEKHVRTAIQHMQRKFGKWILVETEADEQGKSGGRWTPVTGSVVKGQIITSWRVAFLLRLGFLESAERVNFWKTYPCESVWISQERPSFTADGRTDGTAYALFVWSGRHLALARETRIETGLRFLPLWKKRAK